MASSDSPDEIKMVIVARKDVKLGAGKLAAQVAHAAVDCAMKAQRYSPDVYKVWKDAGQRKVVLKADGLPNLHEIKAAAEKLGLTTALIMDAGHTQVEPGTVTVLGVGPGRARDVDRVTGHLALY